MNSEIAHDMMRAAFDGSGIYYQNRVFTDWVWNYFRMKRNLDGSVSTDPLEFVSDEIGVSMNHGDEPDSGIHLNSQGSFRLNNRDRIHYTVWVGTEELTGKQKKWLAGKFVELGIAPKAGLWFDTLEEAVAFHRHIVESQINIPLSQDISL